MMVLAFGYAEISESKYDLASIKFWGLHIDINFDLKDYEDGLKQVC
jgi:hypothetical protein